MQADAPSFERIDYSLRPAKSTERWMLLEALTRLSVFTPLTDYQYVGFSSPFFVDFRLFHRRLALTKMVSIEREVDREARFELNKPFDCIKMLWGDSSDVLREVDWSLPSVSWLDYDCFLDTNVLGDLDQVVESAKHGDSLLVTVDADPPASPDKIAAIERGLGEWGDDLGSRESLLPWRLAEIFYELMDARVRRAVRERGGRLMWVQLWRFHYRDSARMLTYGGVFVGEDRVQDLKAAAFGQMPFTVGKDDDPFVILMPRLTLVETGHIDKFMPDRSSEAVEELSRFGIERDQVERYAAIYRHAPAFHESQS